MIERLWFPVTAMLIVMKACTDGAAAAPETPELGPQEQQRQLDCRKNRRHDRAFAEWVTDSLQRQISARMHRRPVPSLPDFCGPVPQRYILRYGGARSAAKTPARPTAPKDVFSSGLRPEDIY